MTQEFILGKIGSLNPPNETLVDFIKNHKQDFKIEIELNRDHFVLGHVKVKLIIKMSGSSPIGRGHNLKSYKGVSSNLTSRANYYILGPTILKTLINHTIKKITTITIIIILNGSGIGI